MDADTVERLAVYEDDGAIVICDRQNPKAWIRSDTVMTGDSFDAETPVTRPDENPVR